MSDSELEDFGKESCPEKMLEAAEREAAKRLDMPVEIFKEGDDIAKRFDKEKNTGEFNLEMEDYCKKIWKPWLDIHWPHWIDLTRHATQYFQIPVLVKDLNLPNENMKERVEKELKMYAKSIKFPCDGIMHRWGYVQPFDFKFKPKTHLGIGIEVADYEDYYQKYVKLKMPLWLLIWDNSMKKRFWHRVQDPTKYRKNSFGIKDRFGNDIWYRVITADCKEILMKPFNVTLEPRNTVEQLTLHRLSQDPNWSGGAPTKEDLEETLKSVQKIKLEDIYQTVDKVADIPVFSKTSKKRRKARKSHDG